MNIYSYGLNNPLRYTDPSGQTVWDVINGRQSWSQYQVELGQTAETLYNNNGLAKTMMDHPYATGAAVGVGGGLAAYGAIAGMTWLGLIAPAGQQVVQQAEKILENEQLINITADKLAQVISKHTGLFNGSRSVFNKGENVADLIQKAVQSPMIPQIGDKFARIVDMGRNIGVDRFTQQQTSLLTVITDRANNLITSYPGIPKYLTDILNK